jgi:microcystin-dependent protein
MSDQYVGEVRMFAGNFAPVGWLFCDGSLLPIANFDTLFNLVGTTYGGDGVTTFAVPDLRGRAPAHSGAAPGVDTVVQGQLVGEESVTLTVQQIPAHTHPPRAAAEQALSSSPAGAVWAAWADHPYASTAPTVAMNGSAIGPSGGNQPHDNMPPFLTVNFIIATTGIYPSQS